MVSLKEHFKTQVQKWRIQTHPVESQKYSNDLIIRFGQDVTNEVNSHKDIKRL
jgi:hypothetical protein